MRFDVVTERILAEMAEDPTGWDLLDVKKVLMGCEIVIVEEIGDGPGRCEMWRHPDHPSVHFLLFPGQTTLHSAQILPLLTTIGNLRRALDV